MTLLLARLKNFFLSADQLAAQHWRKFVIGGSLILSLLTLRACYEAGRYKQAVHDNPPLPKKEAKVLRAQSKKDSVCAVAYQHIARVYHQQADSALTIARTLTAQADSTHAKASLLPPAARGPISAIEFDLRAYQSPDTAR